MNEQWLQEAIRNKGVPIWTSSYKLKSYRNANNDNHVISLLRGVNDLNRFEIIAVEMVTISEQALEQAYTENDAWDDWVIIVDNTGQVISSKVKDEIGTQVGDQPYVQRVLEHEEGSFQTK